MQEQTEKLVNSRFAQIFEQLKKDGKVKSKSDIASQLGTYNHVINSVLKGERGLTVDQIHRLVDCYGINSNYLFEKSSKIYSNDMHRSNPLSNLGNTSEGKNNITLVPQKAAAGYAITLGNNEYLNEFKKFSIPGLEGDLIAFEISGDSMSPQLTNGDIVVCEPLEKNQLPKDNEVYVVVTDNVVAKRIKRIKNNNGDLSGFELISDNSVYKPYQVDLEEIKMMLKVKNRLTSYGLA
jgi:phage repressor protein C with HTH and peptisase S24 domain